MQTFSFIAIVILSAFAAGCGLRGQAVSDVGSRPTNSIPARFAFITTNTTLQQVIDRVGAYDRVRGSGITYYEYILRDGAAVLVSPVWPFQLTNKIQGVKYFHSTNDIDLYP